MLKLVRQNTTSPFQRLEKQGENANHATHASRQKLHVIRRGLVHVVYFSDDHALSQLNHRLHQGRPARKLPRLHHPQPLPNPQQDAMDRFPFFDTSPTHRFKKIDLQLERRENTLHQETLRHCTPILKMLSFPAIRYQLSSVLANTH